eukprot:6475473-Alexandrium_andersonii.AAC.1
MSASLVGSEMCIRDRPKPGGSSLIGGSCARLSAQAPPGAASAAPRPLTPVSYTHLTLPTICSV